MPHSSERDRGRALGRGLRAVAALGTALALGADASCGPRKPSEQAAAEHAAVELSLRAADGTAFDLAALRGVPLLVFVFTTFDEASQLALTPLTQALKKHAELRALGIAAQPNPQQLLPLYSEALALEFPLAFDPNDRLIAGHTALGAIETVPMYLLLDPEGRVIARHVGAMKEAELDAFFAAIN